MCAMMPFAVRCAALDVRFACAWVARGAVSDFRALYDFCMTFNGLMDRNAKDGKSREAHRLKNSDAGKTIELFE